MNVAYLNPFINATQSVFRSMMEVDPVPGKPFLMDLLSDEYAFDISGIIGLSGEATGAVVISLPKLTALRAVSRFARMDVKIFDQTVVDAIGELINIIAGNAKRDLSEYTLAISLPSVVTGHLHKLNWPTGVPVVSVPFSSNIGDFSISVSLREG